MATAYCIDGPLHAQQAMGVDGYMAWAPDLDKPRPLTADEIRRESHYRWIGWSPNGSKVYKWKEVST